MKWDVVSRITANVWEIFVSPQTLRIVCMWLLSTKKHICSATGGCCTQNKTRLNKKLNVFYTNLETTPCGGRVTVQTSQFSCAKYHSYLSRLKHVFQTSNINSVEHNCSVCCESFPDLQSLFTSRSARTSVIARIKMPRNESERDKKRFLISNSLRVIRRRRLHMQVTLTTWLQDRG